MTRCDICAKRHEKNECAICSDNKDYVSRFKLDTALEAFLDASETARKEYKRLEAEG